LRSPSERGSAWRRHDHQARFLNRQDSIAEDPRRLVLTPDAGRHDLVIGAAHAVPVSSRSFVRFHQLVILSLS
jgi:hypothetical protein